VRRNAEICFKAGGTWVHRWFFKCPTNFVKRVLFGNKKLYEHYNNLIFEAYL